METVLTLDQFRSAFQAGGFQSVIVVASGGRFFIKAQPRVGGSITLATMRGRQARSFADAGQAIAVLHRLGAHKVVVDTSDWRPGDVADDARRRPDTADRQRRAHEAAAHGAWFRGEVEQAVREAGDPNTKWVSHDDAKTSWAARRAGLQARIERDAD